MLKIGYEYLVFVHSLFSYKFQIYYIEQSDCCFIVMGPDYFFWV